MKISLHISGLVMIIAGIIFIVSAVLAKSILLYIIAAVCIVCGILWILPRRVKINLQRNKTKSKSGGGRYSR